MANIRYVVSLFFLIGASVLGTSCAGDRPAVSAKGDKKNKKESVSEYYISEGMKHFLLEDYGEAVTLFKKALEQTPESPAVHHMLARAYFEQQEVQSSLSHAQKAVKFGPENKFYYLFLARLYQVKEDYAAAEDTYKALLENVSETDQYLDDLADVYILQGHLNEAIKILNRIEEVYGKTEQVTRRKQQLYLKEDKVDAALREGYHLINAFPENVEYKISLAEMLVSYGEHGKAMELLDQIIALDPDNPYAQYILASIYKESDQAVKSNDQMLKVFSNPGLELDVKLGLLGELQNKPETTDQQLLQFVEALQEVHSDNPRALMAFGDIYLGMGRKKESWEKYVKAKEMEKSNYSLWNQLLHLDSELGFQDSLVAHAEQALEYYPNQASFWYFLGSGQYFTKKYDEASMSLEQGKNLAVGDEQLNVLVNQMLGDVYYQLGEYKLSDKAYEDALRINRNNLHVLNNYSYFLALREEKLELAKEMAGMLIENAPDNPTFLDTYGWVLFKAGELEKAKDALEKAVQLSGDGVIHEHYGDVLFQMGKVAEAVEQWKLAKEKGGVSENIDKKISEKSLNE